MSEVNKLKVLALINDGGSALTALHFLRKRNYEIKISHKLMDGISLMTEFKPDILLLSWNLKNTDIKKVHSFICNKFKLICFVIGEENNGKTASMMLASALPNLIMPPLGGAYLHTKIQAALQKERAQLSRAGNHQRRKERDRIFFGSLDCKRPTRQEVPKEAKWNIKINSNDSNQQVWESIYYKDGQPKYYYFKGSQPPDKWLENPTGKLEEGIMFMTEHSVDHETLLGFQNLIAEGEVFDSGNNSAENEHAFTGSVPESTNSGYDNRSSSSENSSSKFSHTLLERSVNRAIETEFKTLMADGQTQNTVGIVSRLNVLIIKSPSFKGYLVSCQSDNQSNAEMMRNVFEHLSVEMKTHGEDLTNLCDVISLEIDPISFREFSKDRAEFLVEKTVQQNEILFAYLPMLELPKVFEQGDLNAIELNHFEQDQHLTFDVFLHMPKNQKHIKFLKTGAPLTSSAIDRLKSFEVKQLFIKKADEHSYFAYCAYKQLDFGKKNNELTQSPI
jgi:hypothetical protein